MLIIFSTAFHFIFWIRFTRLLIVVANPHIAHYLRNRGELNYDDKNAEQTHANVQAFPNHVAAIRARRDERAHPPQRTRNPLNSLPKSE